MRLLLLAIAIGLASVACTRQNPDAFVRVSVPVLALTHVRIVDGTGAPAQADQALVIEDGRISKLGRTNRVSLPANARVIDASGRTVIPGLVGMHEHLFYQIERPGSGARIAIAQSSFAKLYLAAGVTTIRTAGTADFDGDLRLKRRVDESAEPGPKIHVTGPYLNGVGDVPNPDAIRRQVVEAADAGATSFKAYTTLRSAELRAAIEAAHQRGLPVTGHLCAVGYSEAATLGIDNIEHGIIFDSELDEDKQPDACPGQSRVFGAILRTEMTDDAVRRTMTALIQRGIAVTSTLAVIESYTGRRDAIDPRVVPVLSSRLQTAYRAAQAAWSDQNAEWPRAWAGLLDKEMQFEKAFVQAGGRLLAGVDPTGWGGVMAGFGDQREVELLVDAGFTPEAAIRIATANGASFLGERDIGTIADGNRADLVVIRGDPSAHISDIRNVETVFKDGVGYDPQALVAATAGSVTDYDFTRLLRWPWNAILGGWLLSVIARRLWRRQRAAGTTPAASSVSG